MKIRPNVIRTQKKHVSFPGKSTLHLKSLVAFTKSITIKKAKKFMGIYAEKWIEKNKNTKAAKDRVITEYNQDLKDSRTNPEYPDLMVAAISDMQVYNYIKKSFKAHNLNDELKKLSGLNSKEVFAKLKAMHIFSKKTLILIKKLNVDLEGSPHW